MVIVPCCYHKMAAAGSFPLSRTVTGLLNQLHISCYGLRLAAQESALWLVMC